MLERSYALDAVAAALVPLLDGGGEWDDVRAALVARGHAEDAVEAALRRLLFLHAVEGAGDAMTAKLERVLRREETVPISILDGARFACQGSGACCQGYAFGPLTDADVAGLDALDLAAAFPHLAAPYVETVGTGRYLRKRGDRCVFLEDDRRCGLHARFGADAKPGLCRLFPLDSFGTVEGVRVVDRGSCATFGVSARTGLPLADDMERLRPLLRAPFLHHPVALVDGWEWDYAIYLRFTSAATALVRRNVGTAGETLMAIGRLLDALTLATARCPIAPGQPEAIVGAVLGVDASSWYRPPRVDAAAAGVRALAELLRELGAAVSDAIARGATAASEARLRALATLMAQTADALDGPAPPPAPAASPDVDEALRISLRQQLFGRHVLVNGLAGAGLVRIALIQLLALAGARVDAGERAITAADLSRGHMLAVRGFQSAKLEELLGEHDPRWRLLLGGLARAAARFAVS